LPASDKQKDYINALIERLKTSYALETTLEKPVEELNKGEAANLIEKLLARGKEAHKNIKKEIPVATPAEPSSEIPVIEEGENIGDPPF
jgi:hypothetical protein